MKVILASQNKHKIEEINAVLSDFGMEVISMIDAGFDDDIPETGTTMEQNAMIKAEYLAKQLPYPVLADDSGLEVFALDGAPGVYSARYAGPQKDDSDNMDKLIRDLETHTDRSSQFKTVLAYIKDGQKYLFSGVVKGQIIDVKRGDNGFGYDPIFVPEGLDKTFAELTSAEKNSMSHRANALVEFRKFLSK